jgi:hypothetical protein
MLAKIGLGYFLGDLFYNVIRSPCDARLHTYTCVTIQLTAMIETASSVSAEKTRNKIFKNIKNRRHCVFFARNVITYTVTVKNVCTYICMYFQITYSLAYHVCM